MTALDLRPLALEGDLELVHGWMQQPHVAPWWELDGPLAVVRDFLARQAQLAHLEQWIASDGEDRAFAYVETYRVPDDELARYYDAQPGDRGFHLLVGPPELLGSGLAHELVCQLVTGLLGEDTSTRIVCEPDARNARMLALCRALGGEELATLELPDRRRVLIGWTRAPQAVGA